MSVTDELMLAWLARPEIVPPPEACGAERALHARLRGAPLSKVARIEIDAIADPDARENWTFLLELRDRLLAAGSIEAGYVSLVRAGVRLPHLFYDQLVQLILRNALDGCEDVWTLRAAELLFRPQRAFVQDGALMLADEELAAELEADMHVNPLGAMLSGGIAELDVLGEDNAWTYWSRSDAHTMVLPFGAAPEAREGLARAIEAFVAHLLGTEVRIAPRVAADDVDLRWFVGLDQTGTAIGNALWHGRPRPGDLVGLLELRFADPAVMLPDVAGAPVFLLIGLDDTNMIRFKPQNLVTGLPLAEGRPVRPERRLA
jgi:hypothetical protein